MIQETLGRGSLENSIDESGKPKMLMTSRIFKHYLCSIIEIREGFSVLVTKRNSRGAPTAILGRNPLGARIAIQHTLSSQWVRVMYILSNCW